MRDIQQVLERFGAWAANNREDVTWSTVAAGVKGLIPSKVTSRPQCCDDDAMVIGTKKGMQNCANSGTKSAQNETEKNGLKI